MKFITVAALLSLVACEEVDEVGPPPFNYGTQDEWGKTEGYEECKLPGGSPINLETAPANPYSEFESSDDQVAKIYSNQNDVTVAWSDFKQTLDIHLTTSPNIFHSKYATEMLNDRSGMFNAESINFHF